MNAYEWGLKHRSCEEGLEARKAYSSQAEWYKACDRGDWLLWQLGKISLSPNTQKALAQAVDAIVGRAVRNHALKCGIADVEQWAQNWLSGKDRSYDAAVKSEWSARAARAARGARAVAEAARAAVQAEWAVAEAARAAVQAEWAAVQAAELKLQADDIHRFIPEWPEVACCTTK